MRKLIRVGMVSLSLLATGTVSAQTTGGSATSGGSGSSGTGDLGISSLTTPTITAQDTPSTSTVLNQSNVFSGYYANPYFQGKAGSTNATAPGGFGTPLYGTSTTAGGTSGRGGFGTTSSGIGTGTSTSRTAGGFGGTTGGFGSTTGGFGSATGGFGATGGRAGQLGGLGGMGGLNSSSAQSQVIPLPRQIAYTATFRFQVQPVSMPRMVVDARSVFDRTTMLAGARNIDVTADGSTLVLRGSVASEDDARLAENLIRLTPGVREIRNELKFPGSNQP